MDLHFNTGVISFCSFLIENIHRHKTFVCLFSNEKIFHVFELAPVRLMNQKGSGLYTGNADNDPALEMRCGIEIKTCPIIKVPHSIHKAAVWSGTNYRNTAISGLTLPKHARLISPS